MLRGRCSCAISSHPSPSPTFQLPLSPLFPLLPGNPLVTPLFPLLTQKQGGGGYLFSLSVLPSTVLGVYPAPIGVPGACPDPVGMVNLLPAAFSFSPLVYPACPELRGKRSPRRVTRHSLQSFPLHWQLLPYELYLPPYLPLHHVSMSARRQFCSGRRQKTAQERPASPARSG